MRIPLGILCYIGLFFTRSPHILAIVAITQIVALFQAMPLVDNHWMFATFIHLALLWHLQPWRRALSISSIKNAFPTVRTLVVCLYLLAAFHKLNTAFFDPSVSCAVVHVRDWIWSTSPAVRALINNNQFVPHFLILGALAVELLVPTLLMHRKLRFIGIILGVLFHLSTRMYHFPSIMFAGYLLFLSRQEIKFLASRFEQLALTLSRDYLGIKAYFRIAWFAASSWLIATGGGPQRPTYYAFLSVWMAVVLMFTGTAFWFLWRAARFSDAKPTFYWRSILLAIFVLNAFSPYLGLKTSTSLAMWSGLNTSDKRANHFFMPSLPAFQYIDNVVEVDASNSEIISGTLIDKNILVAESTLRRMVQQIPRSAVKLTLSINKEGHWLHIDDAHAYYLNESEPYWQRKIVAVRNTTKNGPEQCRW